MMCSFSFIAPSPMTAPKKSIVRTAIFIFVGDKTKPLSSQIFSILSKCLACSFSFFEKTSISSIYTAMNNSVPLKHLSIFLWNIVGAFFKSNGDEVSFYALFRVAGDGVAGIKRRRRDQYSDNVRNLAMTSGRSRLKEDLESSTW
ncbi:hypothetical protein Tco_0190678 [Tanacetum coccineum]